MPDLSERFLSTYLNADTLRVLMDKGGIDPERGELVGTIAGCRQEEMHNPHRGKTKEWVVDFYDISKPLVLSRPIYWAIANLYGPNTDDWTDRRIGLFWASGEGAAGAAAIRVRNKRYSSDRDPIGPKMADRVRASLEARDLKLEDFIRWATRQYPDAKNLDSLELPEYPAIAVRVWMKGWADHLARAAEEKAEAEAERRRQAELAEREDRALEDAERAGAFEGQQHHVPVKAEWMAPFDDGQAGRTARWKCQCGNLIQLTMREPVDDASLPIVTTSVCSRCRRTQVLATPEQAADQPISDEDIPL